MTPTANLASAEDADHPAAPAAEAGPFVLNLCSSTTPMALAQTDLPELKRFTFFVSRRFEEGRERFRLHMGFFETQAEAEEWLNVVREIYPGAWAGEAPGKKLRARAAEAAAAQARHALGPQHTTAVAASVSTPPAASVASRSEPRAAGPPKVPTLVPTLHPPAAAAAGVRPSAPAAGVARTVVPQPAKAAPQSFAKRLGAGVPAQRVAPAPARAAAQTPMSSRATAAARPAPVSRPAQQPRPGTLSASVPTQVGKAAASRPAAPKTPAPAAQARPAAAPMAAKAAPQTALHAARQSPQSPQSPKKPIFADSNVKEVLAALDAPQDLTGETRLMAVPLGRTDTADDSSLTDTQVLRFLETRREEDDVGKPQSPMPGDAGAESGISLLKPDDTGTRRALKEAVSHNEAVSFAVQLQWSVQPVALDKVPPLAIFSAYTLYSVEGSREGRKWYGLRLGFFNDAISAKQVAYYVRSEFASVAVVPVSPQERDRATEDNQRFSGVGAPRKRRGSDDNEFKLIDSDDAAGAAAPATPPSAAQGSAAQPAVPSAAQPPARQPASATRNPGKDSGRDGGKVGARERRTPQTLEETLEILGANELAIDGANTDTASDTGVRHLRVEVQKNTPFSRLLERLSERVRKT